MNKNIIKNQSGYMLLTVMAVATFLIASLSGLASLGVYKQKLYKMQTAKHQALHIAEAGINYYVWHLAHDQEDYTDGTGGSGPYEHEIIAPSSGKEGTYSLEITPPNTGSTIVTIKSTGWINEYPNMKRSITVKYGIPSLATYSLLANTNLWLGNSESTIGPFHSNGGIRMDGSNDSLVTSSRSNYTCESSHGCDSSNCATNGCVWDGSICDCPGIWGAGANSSLWSYPVPTVDFNSITSDISQIKSDAQSDGIYFGNSGGGNNGYHIIFQNNGTFDIYIINSLGINLKQLNDDFKWSPPTNIAEDINTETLDNNYPIPANGLIYFEDDVWIEGTINGRATLVAARLPDNPTKRKNINIMNNINYLARDGNHLLGLIAQKDVKVLRSAPTDLTIDGILLAQNGHVFRNNYADPNKIVKNKIEIYGGIISYLERNFTWVNSGVVTDGYTSTISIYDSQVTYAPPPSFPTTGEYDFISWEEN